MEEEGVVIRDVDRAMPVRVVYHLSDKGRDIEQIVREIQRWADKWEDVQVEIPSQA